MSYFIHSILQNECNKCYLASWGRIRPKVLCSHIFRNFLAKCLQTVFDKDYIKTYIYKQQDGKLGCVSTLFLAHSVFHLCSSCIQLGKELFWCELGGLVSFQSLRCLVGDFLNLAFWRYFALYWTNARLLEPRTVYSSFKRFTSVINVKSLFW